MGRLSKQLLYDSSTKLHFILTQTVSVTEVLTDNVFDAVTTAMSTVHKV